VQGRVIPGRIIVVSTWATNVVFAVTAIPAALGVSSFDTPAVATALVLFAVGLGVWTWAFGLAVVRSARGDDIAVASLYLTAGDAPRPVRAQLFSALGACLLITVATAASDPFGVLVPMLSLGFVGLWAARHGTFPPRPTPAART
jgi:hypothetical protein